MSEQWLISALSGVGLAGLVLAVRGVVAEVAAYRARRVRRDPAVVGVRALVETPPASLTGPYAPAHRRPEAWEDLTLGRRQRARWATGTDEHRILREHLGVA